MMCGLVLALIVYIHDLKYLVNYICFYYITRGVFSIIVVCIHIYIFTGAAHCSLFYRTKLHVSNKKHIVNQIYQNVNIYNESKYQPTHHLYINHSFIQQENKLNTAYTIGTHTTYSMQHNRISKILKKPTPTPKILHINWTIRHIRNTNKFHQIRQHKPQQICLYHILYFINSLLKIYKSM
jgi:hypothetical protein